jgi:putative ATPase
MSGLFDTTPAPAGKPPRPLADELRPRTIDEIVGQEHLLGPGGILRQAVESDQIPSMILWGPPGSGKTTLARVVAHHTQCRFASFSAVISGIKEVKDVIAQAKFHRQDTGQRTILFIDEIHRFNKAQQDAFLPYVEDGSIILIGATTENPSFEVISALLSRTKVFVLNPLETAHLVTIIDRALTWFQGRYTLAPDARQLLAEGSHGDARYCLNTLEMAVQLAGAREAALTAEQISQALQRKFLKYDKDGEEHYNLISALHKSVRGSDPDAALYWFYRMIEAGEDPLFLARRLIRMASEDIGLADPHALTLAVSARDAFQFLGPPEGILALAQAAAYLAVCPKSNAIYTAEAALKGEIRRSGDLGVPLAFRNAPTKLMKDLAYGREYAYDHDTNQAYSGQEHLPDKLTGQTYYHPTGRGFEAEIKKRLEYWRKIKQDKNSVKQQPR